MNRVELLLQALDRPLTAPAALQELRALAVLEMVGTAEAAALLNELGAGEPQAWRTHEARAALRRLEQGRGSREKKTP